MFVLRVASESLAILLLICILTALNFAQFQFDSYTTDNGLPQNGVRQMVQTDDGYLWFTTFDGLVRFDGVTFTVFDRNNTPSIKSNRFTNLTKLPDGSLVAGIEDGGLTVFRDGVFKSFTTTEGLPSNTVMTFRTDANGEFYVVTNNGNAYLRGDQVVPFADAHLPDNSFTLLSPSGTRWSYAKGEVRQRASDGREFVYPIKVDYFNERLSGVSRFEDSKGQLWFGDRSGVYILKDGETRKLTAEDGVPLGTLLRPNAEDDQGAIWFATGWGDLPRLGAVRYHEGKFSVLGKETGLSDLNISQLFRDSEGTIWAATDKGLNHLRRQLFTGYSTESGLVHGEVYPLLQGRDGVVYIGTTRGLSTHRDGKFSIVDIKNEIGDPPSVTSLFEDEKGRLWIGAVGNLHIYENNVLRSVPGFAGLTVWAIEKDQNGDLWIGSGRGLFKMKGEEIAAKFSVADGLPSDDVNVIYPDSRGGLWFGTQGGVARYEQGSFTRLTTVDGLASDRVRSIYETSDGVLWFGTYDGGLSRYANGSFFNFAVANGLFNNGVFKILEDEKSNFWISCNRGIYRVSRDQLEDVVAGRRSRVESVSYGRADGMLSTEANGGRQPAAIRTTDGKFWFPTQEGVAIVDPTKLESNLKPPKVQIERIAVDRQLVDPRTDVSVRSDDENLEISFTGITFVKPEQVKFRYRIEGLSDDWTDVGSRRDVYFPSLPAGNYIFHVIAGNSDGIWDEQGARLNIVVKAPFWKTNWFMAIIAIVAFVFVFASFRLRERRLEQRAEMQRDFSRRLIASQEGERKRIAAELHDSLGQYLLAIKNWAAFGLKSVPEDDAAREYLNEVSDTSSLAITEVRQIAHDLRPYQLERLGLTNTLRQMLKNIETTSTIMFESQIDEVDGVLSKENEIVLYRVVQECVSNVIKHSEATNAVVTLTATDHGAEFICSDDGKGFDVEAAKGSASSGLGLDSIVERAAILGGDLKIESENGKGTKFVLSINRA
ncbi:MAG TPA: two-component regulator propeller domain-containing protein [Pyrinomonadaceae bacterium]|nr:two-component regulator propeller domain-containing protein [Pyrinomonadaceae bacterium]